MITLRVDSRDRSGRRGLHDLAVRISQCDRDVVSPCGGIGVRTRDAKAVVEITRDGSCALHAVAPIDGGAELRCGLGACRREGGNESLECRTRDRLYRQIVQGDRAVVLREDTGDETIGEQQVRLRRIWRSERL